LLNVDYKGFTKVLTGRLTPVTKDVIGNNQTGFIQGRNILEGVVILHEVIHELSHKKKKCLILKINFEKAYDRVRWDFGHVRLSYNMYFSACFFSQNSIFLS
jgi:hypothetical protein